MFPEQFEANEGYRITRRGVSVLLRSTLYGRALTSAQNIALAHAMDTYYRGIQQLAPPKNITLPDAPLTRADFAEISRGPFLKYVKEDVWASLRRGCFWFNTAGYYRSTPNIAIQDRHEGYGHFHLSHGNDQLNVLLTSGHNCAILCGTSQAGAEQLMCDRFGSKRIAIRDVRGFADCVALRIGATRVRVHDVVYRDVLSFADSFPGISRFIEITGKSNLTREALHRLNEEFFDVFYMYGMLPALFTKPLSYADERERRIVFEMPEDLGAPVKVEDKRFLDYITFLDSN